MDAAIRMSDASRGDAGRAGLSAHLPLLGKVAMALVGDAGRVELALEKVAREAAQSAAPEGVETRVWLLGLVRSACATQLSQLPIRTRPLEGASDGAPRTERLGAGLAAPARASLAALKPTEREAVVLALVAGLEAKDIAAACSIDLATARKRLGRGLELLLTSDASSNDKRDDEGGLR